jgi:hypothetical protein
MAILQQLSVLALQPLMGGSAPALLSLLSGQHPASTQRLQQALGVAGERAWPSLEIALAGGLWWGWIQPALGTEAGRALSRQLLAFLDSFPIAGLEGKTQFRRRCLHEVRQARATGLLDTQPAPAMLERQLRILEKAHPQALLRAQWPPLEAIAEQLATTGQTNLSWLLGQHSPSAAPLLVLVVRYFFRREVETNPELARGLTFRQMELLSQRQQTSLDGLNEALQQHRREVDSLLSEWLERVDAGGGTNTSAQPPRLRRPEPAPSSGLFGAAPILILCPHCRQQLSARAPGGGARMKCPLCAGLFVVPAQVQA